MEPRLGIYIHPVLREQVRLLRLYSCRRGPTAWPTTSTPLLEHYPKRAPGASPSAYIDTVYFWRRHAETFYGAARLIELLDAVKATGRLLKRAEVTVEGQSGQRPPHDLRALHRRASTA